MRLEGTPVSAAGPAARFGTMRRGRQPLGDRVLPDAVHDARPPVTTITDDDARSSRPARIDGSRPVRLAHELINPLGGIASFAD